jgi:heptosyltransferase-2
VIVWNKTRNKYVRLFRLAAFIRGQKYDCVINIQRFASSGLITAVSGAKFKTGFNKNPFSFFFTYRIKHLIGKDNRHETERNLDLVRMITDETSAPVKLYPDRNHFARVAEFKKARFITVSPASLWFTKQYPVEKWIEFANGVGEDVWIYYLGSESDRGLCDRVITGTVHKNSVSLAGKLGFLESAALMKDAVMNFVNDSAPLHLASAVNASVTAIFCSTVPEFGFGPMSENSFIVQTPFDLDCRPCGLHGFDACPKKHFKCAFSIDKTVLLNKIC